jgi:hypothetical protein
MLAERILGPVHSARANPMLPLSSCLLRLLSLLLVQQDTRVSHNSPKGDFKTGCLLSAFLRSISVNAGWGRWVEVWSWSKTSSAAMNDFGGFFCSFVTSFTFWKSRRDGGQPRVAYTASDTTSVSLETLRGWPTQAVFWLEWE